MLAMSKGAPTLDGGAIREVLVRKGSVGPHYVSKPESRGWICGKCRRGNLSVQPKKGQQCRVCKARVTQVAHGPGPHIFDSATICFV